MVNLIVWLIIGASIGWMTTVVIGRREDLFIKQAVPQLLVSTDTLFQQRPEGFTGLTQPITIDLAAMPAGDEAETAVPASRDLQERISDVITFSDDSELRLFVLVPSSQGENLATDAYYELLAAISNI